MDHYVTYGYAYPMNKENKLRIEKAAFSNFNHAMTFVKQLKKEMKETDNLCLIEHPAGYTYKPEFEKLLIAEGYNINAKNEITLT